MSSKTALKRVLIMAGGTGGHIFPGLALAECFKKNGVEVHWLGTKNSMEINLVKAANIPFHSINIGGIRRKGIKILLLAPIQLIRATYQAIQILKEMKPDIVCGMGGFVSGPGGLACGLTKRVLVIHEQNAKAGLTNKILAKFAHRILEGFPNVFLPTPKVVTTGNPVRFDIESLPSPAERFVSNNTPLKLLVLGGSLGAQSLNDILPQVLCRFPLMERPQVIHQTGQKHFEKVLADYKTHQVTGDVRPFIEKMSEVYAWADIVLCRAGALTVAELCSVGLGAIFVPFPYAVDDHQTANASFMVKADAAISIPQAALTVDKLATIIEEFVKNPNKCVKMAVAAYRLRQPRVAEHIYTICEEICR